ncbi:MAG TPA: hypothetical protein PLW86_19410, partial [Rhodocyclaceae bacterium]|nr:hypothetical protein [Rhodocyclaceae bacterium]
RLEEAILACRAALEEFTRARVPLEWAWTHYCLGNALNQLASRQSVDQRPITWLQAIDAWGNAQQVWTLEADPRKWGALQSYVGDTLVLIFEITGERRHLDEAVPTLREAVQFQSAAEGYELPFSQDSLCRALLNLGRLNSDRDMLLEARALCSAARAGLEAMGAADGLAETDANLDAIEQALNQL